MSGKPAASVLLRVRDGRILGISRGLDARDINLPGGRAEPSDPSPAHTAARELREETGVLVAPEALEPLVVRDHHQTFWATMVAAWPDQLASRPFEGYVGLWPAEAFVQPHCTYAEHTKLLLRRMGLL